jgi:signal transduction histidine kinase
VESDFHPQAEPLGAGSPYRRSVEFVRQAPATEPPTIGGSLPRGVRLIGRNAVSVIVLVQTLASPGGVTDWPLVAALLLITIAGWTWVTTRRCGDLLDQVALVAVVGAACGLLVLTGAGQGYVAGYAAVFVGPFFYGLPEGIAPYAAGVLAVSLCTALVGRTDVLNGFGNGVGALFFGVAALLWGRVMRTSRHNAELVEELRASREAEQQNAVAAERARLARELHDVLAHTLSSLALHLESTRALARKRDIDPDVTARVADAVRLARAGLDEARAAVDALREQELPGPERVPELVERFAATSGIDCRYTERGQPHPLAAEARVAVFRAVQEGLSNIAKHARPAGVEVALEWSADAVTLRVADHSPTRIATPVTTGTQPGTPETGGHGLRGMRERAELAGGRLSAGPTDDGFALELSLPA